MLELGNFPGVMRGIVTRPHPSVAGAAWVQVPRVHDAAELGPFESAAHIASPIPAGTRVLLAPVEGRADDLVIVALLR